MNKDSEKGDMTILTGEESDNVTKNRINNVADFRGNCSEVESNDALEVEDAGGINPVIVGF